MKKTALSVLLVTGIVALALMIIGAPNLWASRAHASGEVPALADAAVLTTDLSLHGKGICPADPAGAETRIEGMAAAGPNPCKDCPKTIGNCYRVMCSPCCYQCPGSPYLACL